MARAYSFSGGEKRRGSRNGASKLTADNVRHIRAEYKPPHWQADGTWFPGNAGALGVRFGINRRNVLGVVDGTTWGWLE